MTIVQVREIARKRGIRTARMAKADLVKAELPGLKKEEIEVNLTEDTLTISGEKKKERKVEKKDYYRMERSYGSFARSVPLPPGVHTEKARAQFRDGVLEIRIPGAEEVGKKARKVAVE